MNTSTVFLFPGQGAYLPGVLRDLRGEHPAVAEVLSDVDEAATAAGGAAVSKTLLAEDAPTLDRLLADDPETLQLALYATDVIVHRILAAGIEPAVLAGHSLGEIAALTAAGAYDVRTGAEIVCARNAALRPMAGTGGMIALPADEAKAAAVAELVGEGLAVAVLNAPRQVALSGPADALARAEAVAGQAGLRGTRLGAPYPFHNPLLAEAARRFRDRIEGLRQGPLAVPVYSPILGRHYTDADDLPALLASQLTRPVRFADAIRALHAAGFDRFVECGARATLSGLVRATVPDVTTVACLDGRAEPRASLAAALGEPAEVATAPPETPAPVATSLDRTAVLAELRAFYAAELEYPADVLEDDADLEADLGVDSLKQTELLARAGAKYGFTELPEGFSITAYQSLGAIADLLVRAGK